MNEPALKDRSIAKQVSINLVTDLCYLIMPIVQPITRAIWPTHQEGHTLDLAFCSGQGGLKVEDIVIIPLSWTDHYQVCFRLTGPTHLWRGGTIWKACSWTLKDPRRFLNAMRIFLVSMACSYEEDLAFLWNQEVSTAIDKIAVVCSIPDGGR